MTSGGTRRAMSSLRPSHVTHGRIHLASSMAEGHQSINALMNSETNISGTTARSCRLQHREGAENGPLHSGRFVALDPNQGRELQPYLQDAEQSRVNRRSQTPRSAG